MPPNLCAYCLRPGHARPPCHGRLRVAAYVIVTRLTDLEHALQATSERLPGALVVMVVFLGGGLAGIRAPPLDTSPPSSTKEFDEAQPPSFALVLGSRRW